MLNGWAMLFGILCVFFISPAAFGQAELSDSEIIKEINDSERRTRNHVDVKIEDIKKNFESLDKNVAVFNKGITKEMEGMSKRIDDMQGRINLILNLIIGGIITLFLSCSISCWLYYQTFYCRGKAKNDFKRALDLAEKEGDEKLIAEIRQKFS